MKIFKIAAGLVAALLSVQTFAGAIPDQEANSLIKCSQGSTIDAAVADLNGTLASPFWNTRSDLGNYYRLKDYVSSAPVITSLANGSYSVCVTLTRKK